MAEILLGNLTLPTPEPYDKKVPEKQRENLAYALLQVLSLAKDAGFRLSDDQGALNVTVNLDGVEQAIRDLQSVSVILDLGEIKVIRTGKTGSVIQG